MKKGIISVFFAVGLFFLVFTVPVKAANDISIAQYHQLQNQLNAMQGLVGLYSLPGLFDPTLGAIEQSLNQEMLQMQMLNATLTPTLGPVSQTATNNVNNAIKQQQQHVMALYAWQQQEAIAQAIATQQQVLAAQQQAMLLAYQQQQVAMMDAQLRALGLK